MKPSHRGTLGMRTGKGDPLMHLDGDLAGALSAHLPLRVERGASRPSPSPFGRSAHSPGGKTCHERQSPRIQGTQCVESLSESRDIVHCPLLLGTRTCRTRTADAERDTGTSLEQIERLHKTTFQIRQVSPTQKAPAAKGSGQCTSACSNERHRHQRRRLNTLSQVNFQRARHVAQAP